MARNDISTLATKELRQVAKLELAQTKRQLTGTQGYRENRYYDLDLLPTKYSGDGIVNNPNVGGLVAGRPWKTTPNILSGLWRTTYTGYHGNDPTWFDAQPPEAITESVEVQNFSILASLVVISAQWLGYFRAPHTANYTFYILSDDEANFWIGDKAITGYTIENRDVYAYSSDPVQEYSNAEPIALVAGQYYPIRLQWGNQFGNGGLNGFSWEDDFGPPAPVTQDLILFFDSERTDCYPGTGTTIYNIVDLPTQTPSTLFGNVTYSNGVLRIHNEDTPHPNNRISGIQCQTVTGFKTISMWYKQITDSAGYYSYILDARDGMPGGWIYDTPSSDWFGSDWGAGTMFIDGGASQSPTYTQQLNVWRNVTFVTNGTAFTDNIALFSRNNHIEGLDVEFGAVMIYSRAITEEENKHNYDQFKTRYGL